MKLFASDFDDAARELGVPSAAVRAVVAVESNGSGFYESGTPKVLFERHVMHKRVSKKFGQEKADEAFANWPEVCNPRPGGYGPSYDQPRRMEMASKLIDRECALESASWGLFQIMGYHWKALGYKSLQEFVNAMYANESEHLKAFVKFIKLDPGLHKALKDLNWAGFAKRYNGPNYKENDYDTKLSNSYRANGGK